MTVYDETLKDENVEFRAEIDESWELPPFTRRKPLLRHTLTSGLDLCLRSLADSSCGAPAIHSQEIPAAKSVS